MRKYIYQGKEYNSLWALRNETKNLVFCEDTPVELLGQMGIEVVDIPDPQPDPAEEAKRELERKMARIDAETAAAIMAGFDYEINGEKLHFSYDSLDQQNFADTANACLMAKSGMEGLPASVTWNGYREDGSLARVELSADQFLALYAGGALAHKAACMERGGAEKAALMAS